MPSKNTRKANIKERKIKQHVHTSGGTPPRKRLTNKKMKNNSKRCKFILPDGTQCGAYALKSKKYCFSHDPENKEQKALAVKKGAYASQIKLEKPLEPVEIEKLEDVIKLLITTINEVRQAKMSPKIGNTISVLANTLLRAYQLAYTDKKLDEVRAVLNVKRIRKEVEYD